MIASSLRSTSHAYEEHQAFCSLAATLSLATFVGLRGVWRQPNVEQRSRNCKKRRTHLETPIWHPLFWKPPPPPMFCLVKDERPASSRQGSALIWMRARGFGWVEEGAGSDGAVWSGFKFWSSCLGARGQIGSGGPRSRMDQWVLVLSHVSEPAGPQARDADPF